MSFPIWFIFVINLFHDYQLRCVFMIVIVIF